MGYTSISAEFQDQLALLMEIVQGTEPHFIRCIKPNSQSEPNSCDRISVTTQLRYSGVLQAIQVSRMGYPVRLAHKDFFEKFKLIVSKKVEHDFRKIGDAKARADRLIQYIDAEFGLPKTSKGGAAWAVGKNPRIPQNERRRKNQLSSARTACQACSDRPSQVEG